MNKLEYTEVELPFIEQLKGYGYIHLQGPELDVERSSKATIVLEQRFAKAIHALNPWINDSNVEKVVKQFVSLQAEDTWHANKTIFEWLFGQGISVMQDLGSGKKNQTVILFDFEKPNNNEFLVVNQLSIENANGTIRPDIVLYINGLPLVLVECKSPKLQVDKQLPEGVRQFERYMQTNVAYSLFLHL